MYASSEVTGVSEQRVHDRQSENLPCIPEEVELDLGRQISTLWAAAVITEIKKRVAMRTVMGFVALLAPVRLFPCASRPFVDAALDLMSSTTPSTSRVRARKFDPHRRECKGNYFDRDG